MNKTSWGWCPKFGLKTPGFPRCICSRTRFWCFHHCVLLFVFCFSPVTCVYIHRPLCFRSWQLTTWISLSVIDFFVQPFYSPFWDPHVQVAPAPAPPAKAGRLPKILWLFWPSVTWPKSRRGVRGWRFWLASRKWQNGHRESRGPDRPPRDPKDGSRKSEASFQGLAMSPWNIKNCSQIKKLFTKKPWQFCDFMPFLEWFLFVTRSHILVVGDPYSYCRWWFQFFLMFTCTVYPFLGKWSNLTNIFQTGWNHQLGNLPTWF